ncbi:MAG: hypothetical protein HYW95_01895 [Candidatus Wildermuthbacteria bacterium]|nr:hypothetical protein [Candidatus Wildermuthbacteria bacterium]
MSITQDIQEVLVAMFPRQHIGNLLRHYNGAIRAYHESDWEECVAKSGKFVEAALKMLCISSGNTLPPARQFGVEGVINTLQNTAAGSCHDSIRITIPRACRFLYDIASNRGARHDPTEVNPNKMDASVAVPIMSWILAEIIRIAGSSADPDEAAVLVETVIERKYPYLEAIDDQLFINIRGLYPREIALLLLNAFSPKRTKRADLVKLIQDHGCSKNAAQIAVTKIKNMVAENENGLVLRGLGRQEADAILSRVYED